MLTLPPPLRLLAAASVLVGLLAAEDARAQDRDWNTLPAGRIQVGVRGIFTSADQRFGRRVEGGGVVREVEPLAFDLQAANAATLFPGNAVLASELALILGDAGYAPALGTSQAYLQASQVRVPFEVSLGVTDWATLEVTVPFVRSRLEGEFAVLPSASADVGVNPFFDRGAEVAAFTSALQSAAAALPQPQADLWGFWAERWVAAYSVATLFPAEGTPVAAALASRLAEFNTVLTNAGVAPITGPIPLANGPLNDAALRVLLSDPGANLGVLPLATALLWEPGDIHVRGRIRLLRGPDDALTGRPLYGLVTSAHLNLPTGRFAESRTLYPIQESAAALGYGGGLAGWFRRGRLGLAAAGRLTAFQSAPVTRRIGLPGARPPDQLLLPRSSAATLDRTPGRILEVDLRPSLRMGRSLWLEAQYRFRDQGADRYDWSAVGGSDPLLPDPGFLARETASTLQTAGGGLRFQPPEGSFPLEVWVLVEVAVAGSGGQTWKETRLNLGARLTRQLWGR